MANEFVSTSKAIKLLQVDANSATAAIAAALYDVTNIVVSPDFLTIDCDVTNIFFVEPHITIRIAPDELKIIVTKAWTANGETDYKMSPQDLMALHTWLVLANFPIPSPGP